MILELRESQRSDSVEGRVIDVVIDAHDGIDFAGVIGQGTIEEMLRRQISKDGPRRFTFRFALGRQTSVPIARFADVGGAQKLLQAAKANVAIERPARVELIRLRLRHDNLAERPQSFHDDAPDSVKPNTDTGMTWSRRGPRWAY